MKKNILQISFHMFKQILTYKCAMNGVYVSLVDPAQSEQALLVRKNTSKVCSCCGNIDNQSSNRMQQALLVKKHYNIERTSLLSECNKQSIACKKACKKKSI